jgi:hypothetical protein
VIKISQKNIKIIFYQTFLLLAIPSFSPSFSLAQSFAPTQQP